jgi:hypothetical protein
LRSATRQNRLGRLPATFRKPDQMGVLTETHCTFGHLDLVPAQAIKCLQLRTFLDKVPPACCLALRWHQLSCRRTNLGAAMAERGWRIFAARFVGGGSLLFGRWIAPQGRSNESFPSAPRCMFKPKSSTTKACVAAG